MAGAAAAVNLYSSMGGPDPIRPGEMALWDLTAHRWRTLTTPPGHPGLAAMPVWTGTELLALTVGGQLFSLHR